MALVVEDRVGIAEDFSADDLRHFLKSQPTAPCAVAVLNACYSERLAETLLQAGVQHAIVIDGSQQVLDSACRDFSRAFYPILFKTGNVRNAFLAGRHAARNKLRQYQHESMDPFKSVSESLKFRHIEAPRAMETLRFEQASDPPVLPQRRNSNLTPVSADPFVGRQRTLHTIIKSLVGQLDSRLVHLKAMGGMGKSATAMAVARWTYERQLFPDGVWVAELRNLKSTEQVETEVVRIAAKADDVVTLDDLYQEIGTGRHLFVLDDVDALLQNDRERLIVLLRGLTSLPGCRIITTSREACPEEVVHTEVVIDHLNDEESIEVFRRYAGSDVINLSSQEERDAFRDVLGFLDGYAFPLRLASAYLRRERCSLAKLFERLQTAPKPTLEFVYAARTRETSLHATLLISYAVLSSAAREALDALAVFPGGLSERAAAALRVSNGLEAFKELDHYSMAEVVVEPGGVRRFQLPEPARHFAREVGDEVARPLYRLSLLRHFAQEFSEISVETLRLRMAEEKSNVYMLLDAGMNEESDVTYNLELARFAVALSRYWQGFGRAEAELGRSYLETSYKAATEFGDVPLSAACSKSLGDLAQARGFNAEALVLYKRASEAYISVGRWAEAAYAERISGTTAVLLSDQKLAAGHFAEAAVLYGKAGLPLEKAAALHAKATAHLSAGETSLAAAVLIEAAEAASILDPGTAALHNYHASQVLRHLGDPLALESLLLSHRQCPESEHQLMRTIREDLLRTLPSGSDRARVAAQLAVTLQVLDMKTQAISALIIAGDDFGTAFQGEAKEAYQKALALAEIVDASLVDSIVNKLIDVTSASRSTEAAAGDDGDA